MQSQTVDTWTWTDGSKGFAANAVWAAYKSNQDCNLPTSIAAASATKIFAACIATAVLNIAATQFSKEPENTCWKIYPVSQANPYICYNSSFFDTRSQICDGWGLQEHVRLPFFIKQQNLYGTCLLMVAILTCLHWSCVFSLFCQREWKDKFLHATIVAAFITLLPIATIVRDPALVFLGFLPTVIDIYASICLFFEYACQKKVFDQETSDSNII